MLLRASSEALGLLWDALGGLLGASREPRDHLGLLLRLFCGSPDTFSPLKGLQSLKITLRSSSSSLFGSILSAKDDPSDPQTRGFYRTNQRILEDQPSRFGPNIKARMSNSVKGSAGAPKGLQLGHKGTLGRPTGDLMHQIDCMIGSYQIRD